MTGSSAQDVVEYTYEYQYVLCIFCNVLMYFLGCLPNLQWTSRQLQERIIQKKIFIQPICLYLINNKNKNIFGNKIKANITN